MNEVDGALQGCSGVPCAEEIRCETDLLVKLSCCVGTVGVRVEEALIEGKMYGKESRRERNEVCRIIAEHTFC